MTEIGDFVIREACAQLRTWLNAGMPAIRIAINVSLCQLVRGDIPYLNFARFGRRASRHRQ